MKLFKKNKDKEIEAKKGDAPYRDIHVALMSLPTVSIIFGTTSLIGDPLLASFGAVSSACITLYGVVRGSRGINNLAERENSLTNKNNVQEGLKYGAPVGENAEKLNLDLTDLKKKKLSKAEQDAIDLAEAKKILEDSQEKRDNDFTNMFERENVKDVDSSEVIENQNVKIENEGTKNA